MPDVLRINQHGLTRGKGFERQSSPAGELGAPGALALDSVLDVPVAHIRDAPVAPAPAFRAVPPDGPAHAEVERVPDHRDGLGGLGREREDVVGRMRGVARALW